MTCAKTVGVTLPSTQIVDFLRILTNLGKTVFYIFDQRILPTLYQGAEIYGGKQWAELEKVHLSTRKCILGVSDLQLSHGLS